MFSSLCRTLYAVTLLVNMLWAAVFMRVLSVLPLSKKLFQGYSLMITQSAWRITFFLSPWVRCIPAGNIWDEWKPVLILAKAGEADTNKEAKKPPVFILGNHTSFLDTVLATTVFPWQVLWRCRTYMDNALFKLPILATICRSIGHFPVYFTSSENGVFKVDAEKMEGVERAVDDHLSNGGWLCFFPEGQVNKEPDKILPFRYGGIKKALKFNARLVSFVSHGNTKVWPRKASVGGFPATVRYSVKALAPEGANSLLAQLRTDCSDEERDIPDHELLSRWLRDRMQQQYDDLASGGVVHAKAD